MEEKDKLNEFFKISEEMRDAFEKAAEADEKAADEFWQSLSYEDKCNAFHAVVKRIVKAEMKDKGSYRYALYDVFEFEPEMYVRGMECGYMDLHNAIEVDHDNARSAQ